MKECAFKEEGTVHNVNISLLLEDKTDGVDERKRSWYAEPRYTFTRYLDDGSEVVIGTFRSPQCEWVGIFPSGMC